VLNLVGGEWVEADSGAEIEVVDPATDDIIGTVPNCGCNEASQAISAAEAALDQWMATPPDARYAVLASFAGLIREHSESLADSITAEAGKPLAEAVAEVALGAAFMQWSAEEGRRLGGELLPCSTPGKRLFMVRRPVGVVGAITPWNFPVALVTRKIGPALAAGCTVVHKPSEKTPISALMLGEFALRAGIPPGVLNIVTGNPAEIAEELIDHPAVKIVSFTGSTAVGRWLVQKSANTFTRLLLELGGDAPFIVFGDADIDRAVADAVSIKFRNAGQTCVAATRFLIHRDIYDRFLAGFHAAIGNLRLGHGRVPGVTIGPLIDDHAVAKVRRHVADAVDKGATLIHGGLTDSTVGGVDRFYQPTLLEGWTPEMLITREETFGPVAGLRVFESEKEALELANCGNFGLAGYVYTQDAKRAFTMMDELDCGIIGINDVVTAAPQVPLGGMKHSGWGREGGRLALESYLDIKYANWRL
jgi:succinate-semialdehyde dehydrogenase/glutarate-semialdehyde dehydrogenase